MQHDLSAPSPATFAGVPVAAMEAVLAQRARQILDYGHTAERDAELPACHLPKEARAYLDGALDELLWRKPGWRARAEKKLTKAGALTLAAIDRVQLEHEDR